MYLRELKMDDAPIILSWMHDIRVTGQLKSDYASKNHKDVEHLIKQSWENRDSITLAIASDDDLYMGTVSLKHIEDSSAEIAIIVRYEAMGRGYSWYGMDSIIMKAFNELNLECVYWCVSRDNERAIRFCNKHNFHEAIDIPQKILNRYRGVNNLKWYSVLKGDNYNARDYVAGCQVIRIRTIPTVNAGELSYFEANKDFKFDIRRIYYISKVPEGVRRGFHAHKELKQLLYCPYGRIQLILESRHGRGEIELSDPSIGVLIEEPTWREMLWIQSNSVLCVAASDYYNSDDYIRDYKSFKEYIK